MDFSCDRKFWVFSLFVLITIGFVTGESSGETNETTSRPKVQSRSRHHKAFFSDEFDESSFSTGIFPEHYGSTELENVKFSQEEERSDGGSQFESNMDEEKAIDAILRATRTGRQLDIEKIDDEKLNQLITDPVILEKLEAGNEAEARGLIRDKLCALGLMTCKHGYLHKRPAPHYGPAHHYKPRPPPIYSPPPVLVPQAGSHHYHSTSHFEKGHYGQGIGHIHGGSIPAKDVSLVQPVSLQPVGRPISAVTLNHKPLHSSYVKSPPVSYGPSRPVPPYVPPPPIKKHIYPSPQIISEPIVKPVVSVEKKIVEHVHHHVHHQGGPGGNFGSAGSSGLPKQTYGEYGVIGTQFGHDDGFYEAAQKQFVAVAAPPATKGVSKPQTVSTNILGAPGHARTCICVPIEQCILDGQEKRSELDAVGSSGSEVIQGSGAPHSGLVGYGIDPRNSKGKGRSLAIEPISTTESELTTENPLITTISDEAIVDSSTNASSRRTKRSTSSISIRPTVIVKRNATMPVYKGKGRSSARRLGHNSGCRIRSIGTICCDPSRIKNPLRRQIPLGQTTTNGINQLVHSHSFNQAVLYNPTSPVAGGFSPSFYGQCGKRNAHGGILGRVITATVNSVSDGETDFGEYPWQVAVLKRDGTFICGGSLIDGNHIMTAAHGIKNYRASDLRVRLGEWDVNHNTEFYPHFERQISSVKIHPQFYAGNLLNDIAILRFEGTVDFRKFPHISPVCIAPKGTDVTGRRCFVTGWGKNAFGKGGKYQHVLKEIDLPILSNFDCEQKLKRTKLGADFVLNPGFLCAGGEAGKDACKGDGGGPLVCEIQSGSWAQVGIVSWGVGCGERDVPGVYVAVEHYQEWIQNVINSSS